MVTSFVALPLVSYTPPIVVAANRSNIMEGKKKEIIIPVNSVSSLEIMDERSICKRRSQKRPSWSGGWMKMVSR